MELKLSPSKITTYMGCSFAYWLQYIVHEKVPQNVRLAFGSRIHYFLNRFYKLNYKSPETFIASWRYDWRAYIAGETLKGKAKRELEMKSYTYKGKDKEGKKVDKELLVGSYVDMGPEPLGIFFGYSKLGENILKRFYERHKLKPVPLYMELFFGKKKDEIIKISEHLVTGVFDRIDRIDGEFYVTDYKTDKSSPEKDSFVLHRHPQFTLYSFVFRELFSEKEKAMLYYHLRTGQVFKTHRSEKDYDYLKRLCDEVVEGIEKSRFIPFYGFHCNFCDYKIACEKYSLPHHGGPRIDLEGKIKDAEKFDKWSPDVEVPSWMEHSEEV